MNGCYTDRGASDAAGGTFANRARMGANVRIP